MKHFLNTQRIGIGRNGCEECDLIVADTIENFCHSIIQQKPKGYHAVQQLTYKQSTQLAEQISSLEPCYECEEE